jgi:extracellular factor (EF) 3-hydroxypalmitic acid methyl ester biosynthesis protein
MLEPGGLLISTNVDVSNPSRNGMEYLLEWHLIYRNKEQLKALIPDDVPVQNAHIKSDETGVNHFIEIRKCDER